MKKQTFYYKDRHAGKWIKGTGYPITLSRFPLAKWLVSKGPESGLWWVVERTTGLAIRGVSEKTLKRAKSKASKTLSKSSEERVMRAIGQCEKVPQALWDALEGEEGGEDKEV